MRVALIEISVPYVEICEVFIYCLFSDVRLKNYGLESIEVIDNGVGVEECNFQALSELLVGDF